MKVTEEMIVTASQRYADRAGRVIASGDVRAMLEAALADVPEPVDEAVTALAAELYAKRGDQLARVRAVLDMTRKLTPEVSAMCEQLARALLVEQP